MDLANRSAFGWPASGGAAANPRKGLVIHYDGSNQGLAGKPHSACVTYWKNTRKFHMGPSRGWADIGYSYFACPHGRVLEGRGLNREQAAQPGGNRDYYSVTLASGPSEQPTAAQINAVRELRAWLMARGVAGTMKGHRDFFATACPGDRLYRLVKDGTFTRAPKGDDDMPTPGDLWSHEIPVPWGSKSNPEWQAESILVNSGARLRNVEDKIDKLTARVEALWRLDELPAPGYNPDDPFDPDNPGFDPARNPTWAAQSFLRQTVQGLLVLNGKVDALAARLDKE